MKLIRKAALYIKECRKNDCDIFLVILRYVYYKSIYNKKIIAHQKVKIEGINNIITKANLHIGDFYIGFSMKNDPTLLNIRGKMIINGPYSIGRGCRFDIAENATLIIGNGGFINANSIISISSGLKIGNDCSISWGCQFIDSDFHIINYERKIERSNEILIDNHVWIGCNACLLKGTVIPDNCVIAANSVVSGIFKEKSVLIGGNPAKIIRRDITWKA